MRGKPVLKDGITHSREEASLRLDSGNEWAGWEAAALGSSGIPGGGSQDVMCRGMRVYSSDVHTVIL